MTINLNINKKEFTPKFYPYIFDYSHRWELYMGSAGSGKSYFITQKILLRCLKEQIRVLVCRRYGSTIRETVFALFKDIITKWQLREHIKINESDYRIRLPNGSEIIFTGLDEETKLLSLANISTIWIEEAYEVSQPMVEQLDLRLRGKNENQQIILSWNPISKTSWLYTFSEINPPNDSIYIKSTYRDNPFLNKEYIATLEELRTRNPQKARIYCDGEWGINTDALVFQNWTTSAFSIEEVAQKYEHRVGADLGFSDPTAIADSFYDKQNKIIYVANEFYKTGQQLDQVLKAIHEMKLTKSKIVFDSAEPRTIDYFKRNQINAVPCIKGQNSVKARISFLQNHKIIIHPQCTNIANEFENFSYILDKKTNTFTEDTTHEFSHGIDALGYSYADIYTKAGLRTIDKSILAI